MTQKIQVQVALDKSYGNDLVRPICPTAINLCRLTGKKTFTQRAINIAKELGYEFEIVQAPSASFQL